MLTVPLLCSCSSIGPNSSSINTYFKIDITNKQFFNMGGYTTSSEGTTISLSRASFYYFKDNICTFWEKDSNSKATSNYQVTFYYFKIIDKIAFKCIFEDIYESIKKPLNKVEDLNDELISSFYNEHPLLENMSYEYLCECGNDVLLVKRPSSDVDQLYITVQAAQEFGVSFVD